MKKWSGGGQSNGIQSLHNFKESFIFNKRRKNIEYKLYWDRHFIQHSTLFKRTEVTKPMLDSSTPLYGYSARQYISEETQKTTWSILSEFTG